MAEEGQKLAEQGSEVVEVPRNAKERIDGVTQDAASRFTGEEADDTEKSPAQVKTPSSAGRQRRRPLKFQVSDPESTTVTLGPARRSSQPKTPRRTPAKKCQEEDLGNKALVNRKASKMDAGVNGEAEEEEEEIPKKRKRKACARYSPAKKKTPVKKRPASQKNTSQDQEAAAAEEEEPARKKPQRKRKLAGAGRDSAPAFQEARRETPEEPEVTPGGRPRRGAAKAALRYLHNLAKEVLSEPGSDDSPTPSPAPSPAPGQCGRGRKKGTSASDRDSTVEDEDFVPVGMEEEEEEESEDEGVPEPMEPRSKNQAAKNSTKTQPLQLQGKAPNGLPNCLMKAVWDANKATKNYHDQHSSSWVFPEWIPSEKDWPVLPERECERYLPRQQQSPAFRVSREGIKEDAPLRSLNRFESLPPHPERWDMLFYVGGPVWALDWCPTPEGAQARQYAALYCHGDQDEQHRFNQTHAQPGLIQLWDLGCLDYNTRPSSPPGLAYGLAQEKGCVPILKWCPAGAWELPSTARKAPLLPRLGLLAAASSSGHISIYSLPHPSALKPSSTGDPSQAPLICQAEAVITLRLGSVKASHENRSGQVLSLDWLPVAPYNRIAAGFYDGMVGLWDLSSRSVLLRVRSPDRCLTLLPCHAFLAHDNAIRALSFCPASSGLLVTAGDDRMLKIWDLRMTSEPISCLKRFLSTEVSWPLLWPGVFLAQENAYATYGNHGLNYFDGSYMGWKPLFLIPRIGTLWSISMSDWLNTLVTADACGEVIMSAMPRLDTTVYIKRTVDRRYPVYFTDMVLLDNLPSRGEEEQERKERGEEGKERGEEEGKEGGEESNGLLYKPATFRETAQIYYLHYSDLDMRSLHNFQKRGLWKRMQVTELKRPLDLDLLTLGALHTVRFNPNLSAQTWILSAGQAGLVRAHCLGALTSPHVNKVVKESQNQFRTMFSPDPSESPADTVRHFTEPL
ncbi:general transcription factor 3C polypeptide 2 isoform X1 [Osmerus eperlanus]|uniref:general transcription factor 3C polypeptide 2 isoform X1 n=1 Tax=Osmerus eperlanus TaxID=29151 RepID=UPI002E0DD050